jgi:hypothetical protein
MLHLMTIANHIDNRHVIPSVKYHQLENSAEDSAEDSSEKENNSDYLGVQGVNIRTGRCGSGTWVSEENGWNYIEDEKVEQKELKGKKSLMDLVREGLGDWNDGEETIKEKRERRHRRSFR